MMSYVQVESTTPAGIVTVSTQHYYEVTDALTVAEIERRNALIPVGRVEVPDHFRLEYRIKSPYGEEEVVITVRDFITHEALTLRDPVR